MAVSDCKLSPAHSQTFLLIVFSLIGPFVFIVYIVSRLQSRGQQSSKGGYSKITDLEATEGEKDGLMSGEDELPAYEEAAKE